MRIFALAVLLGTCLFAVEVLSAPVDENELRNGKQCNGLCSQCGCMAFYCGEECICECNGAGSGDGHCVDDIQRSAQQLKVPYELLIQGPKGNVVLERALTLHPAKESSKRDTRQSVVLYRPKLVLIDDNDLDSAQCSNEGGRAKREAKGGDAMPWFADTSVFEVKPAPIPGMKRQSEDDMYKRSCGDKPWFEDPANFGVKSSITDKLDELKYGNLLPHLKSRITDLKDHFKIRKVEEDELKAKKILLHPLKGLELEAVGDRVRDALSDLKDRTGKFLYSAKSHLFDYPRSDDKYPLHEYIS